MAAAFSIREYVASMRASAASDRGSVLGVEQLPPMEVRKFRWWADELAAAAAAAATAATAAAAARSAGKPRAPKKRSISDLFAAAPPVAAHANEEVEVDESLYAIRRKAKEKKKRMRMRSEEGARKIGERGDQEGNIADFARKETPDEPKIPDPLDTPQTSKEPEGEHHLRTEKEKIPDIKGRKPGKIKNLRKKKKKQQKLKYIQSIKSTKVGKQRDLTKMLPLHSILKKYTKRRSSVKLVKEKHSNPRGAEVIELCHKSVKRVTFSEVDDILDSKKQSSKLPQLESLCKLFSDVLASSSSSTDMSSEGDRSIAEDSSSSHRHEETFHETNQSNENTDHEDYPEPSDTELSSSLIDLNQALPESSDSDYLQISNSEVPNLEHTKDETSNSDLQNLDDGREAVLKHRQNLSFDSQRVEYELRTTDLERIRNSKSAGTMLHGEASKVSVGQIIGLPLNLRGEIVKLHPDFNESSASDTRRKGKSPCALPNQTVQCSVQIHQNSCSTNLNHNASQIFTGGEVPWCECRECNLSHTNKRKFHSGMDGQHEFRPASGQTVRLMGKDLTVCTTRSECLSETSWNHANPSTEDHLLTTKMFLELPREGQPFLSLQSQSFSNVSASSTAGTSLAHFGYRPLHDFSYPFRTTVDVFSGNRNRTLYEDRFSDSSNWHRIKNICLPLPGHDSSSFHQHSLAPWCYYSDPFARTEPHTVPLLPTFTRQVTPSAVFDANWPRPCGVHSASSSVRPYDHASYRYAFKRPDQIIQEVSDIRSDGALPSRNADNNTATALVGNSSTSTSAALCARRSGLVKLSAGAKHILEPSESTRV